jgi:hypothetical protein
MTRKGDSLAKGLALIQALLLVIQLLVQYSYDKASSPLEIMTVAFSACALITYGFLWNQPKDASTPIYIQAFRHPSVDEMDQLSQAGPIQFWQFYDPPGGIEFNSHHPLGENDSGIESTLFALASMGVGALIFGSIHLFAWNLAFPTDAERVIWIIASFITALMPGALVAIFFVMLLLTKSPHILFAPAFLSILIPGMLVFGLARLYIVVEAFRSVYFLPPGAFTSTWASNSPHLG